MLHFCLLVENKIRLLFSAAPSLLSSLFHPVSLPSPTSATFAARDIHYLESKVYVVGCRGARYKHLGAWHNEQKGRCKAESARAEQ